MKVITRWMIASGAAVALGLVAYLSLNSDSRKRPEAADKAAIQEAGARILASNPVEQWRDELDRDALEESLACVDDAGMMTCGKYAGQQALVYLALIGSNARIPQLSTREILVNQGDQAVAAAAALGNLALRENEWVDIAHFLIKRPVACRLGP